MSTTLSSVVSEFNNLNSVASAVLSRVVGVDGRVKSKKLPTSVANQSAPDLLVGAWQAAAVETPKYFASKLNPALAEIKTRLEAVEEESDPSVIASIQASIASNLSAITSQGVDLAEVQQGLIETSGYIGAVPEGQTLWGHVSTLESYVGDATLDSGLDVGTTVNALGTSIAMLAVELGSVPTGQNAWGKASDAAIAATAAAEQASDAYDLATEARTIAQTASTYAQHANANATRAALVNRLVAPTLGFTVSLTNGTDLGNFEYGAASSVAEYFDVVLTIGDAGVWILLAESDMASAALDFMQHDSSGNLINFVRDEHGCTLSANSGDVIVIRQYIDGNDTIKTQLLAAYNA